MLVGYRELDLLPQSFVRRELVIRSVRFVPILTMDFVVRIRLRHHLLDRQVDPPLSVRGVLARTTAMLDLAPVRRIDTPVPHGLVFGVVVPGHAVTGDPVRAVPVVAEVRHGHRLGRAELSERPRVVEQHLVQHAGGTASALLFVLGWIVPDRRRFQDPARAGRRRISLGCQSVHTLQRDRVEGRGVPVDCFGECPEVSAHQSSTDAHDDDGRPDHAAIGFAVIVLASQPGHHPDAGCDHGDTEYRPIDIVLNDVDQVLALLIEGRERSRSDRKLLEADRQATKESAGLEHHLRDVSGGRVHR